MHVANPRPPAKKRCCEETAKQPPPAPHPGAPRADAHRPRAWTPQHKRHPRAQQSPCAADLGARSTGPAPGSSTAPTRTSKNGCQNPTRTPTPIRRPRPSPGAPAHRTPTRGAPRRLTTTATPRRTRDPRTHLPHASPRTPCALPRCALYCFCIVDPCPSTTCPCAFAAAQPGAPRWKTVTPWRRLGRCGPTDSCCAMRSLTAPVQ